MCPLLLLLLLLFTLLLLLLLFIYDFVIVKADKNSIPFRPLCLLLSISKKDFELLQAMLG